MLTGLSPGASAETVYDATTGTLFENPLGPAPVLDDLTLVLPSGTPPINITGVSFGARNVDEADQTVDLLLTFFDNANTAAVDAQTVESGLIGTARISNVVVPAADKETFIRQLASPLQLPNGTVAVRLTFVAPTTTTVSEVVDALAVSELPTIGNTVDKFWSDQGVFNQTFTGSEQVEPDLLAEPPIHANLYLRLEGVAVPEPGTVGLLAAGSILLLRRRSRRVC